jgi:glycine oxidase
VIENKDVVVVGGGLIGAACSRELAARGWSVLVLEPANRLGAAWRASAGLLAPQLDSASGRPWFDFGIAGRNFYRGEAPALLAETGIDVELFSGGILQLATSDEEAARFRGAVASQADRELIWLDPTQLRQRFDWVGDNHGALHATRDGSLNPARLVEALRASAVHRGVRFETDAAVTVVVEKGRVARIRGERAEYTTGQVVVAAGGWSGGIAGLPRQLAIEPVRGQMVAKPWPRHIAPAIVYGFHNYVLERNGEAWCGATMERVGFSSSPTDEGQAEVVAATNRLVPALVEQPVLRGWAGLRPVTPDGLPILGRDPHVEGLWYATGHGRNGVLLAGVSAVALADMITGEPCHPATALMRADRFA